MIPAARPSVFRNVHQNCILPLLLAIHLTGDPLLAVEPSPPARDPVSTLLQARDQLDKTVWAEEVQAQAFEQTIVRLWDRLRTAENQLDVLAEFPLEAIAYGAPAASDILDLGIRRIRFSGASKASDASVLGAKEWKALLASFREQGFELIESEWHHSAFSSTENAPVSTVDFVLHAMQHRGDKKRPADPRLILRGKLKIEWATAKREARPITASRVTVQELEILTRVGGPVFQKAFTYTRRERDVASAHPILVYDLDNNGYPEVVISRWNRVYWNQGGGKFREATLLDKPIRLAEAAMIVDIDRNGSPDLISIDAQGRVVRFKGDATGKFTTRHEVISDVAMPSALAMTAGDIDRDGDLDLWISQYKPAYQQGQMPTPYYDANDGELSSLLINDGRGRFVDRTVALGLGKHRRRRTYSSSLVDIDGDRDLDLLKVSDYAGVDIYRNDGRGQFSQETEALVEQRHLFGMAHTLGDFNLDGRLDFYAIGMSSTTARRLDEMQLGRDDRQDIHRMRSAMGWGNRMYQWNGRKFETPQFASQVARTGWSWGATTFDFDLDGDEDIYVANGFRSGQSCEDYCSTFWRHDIYSGDSSADPLVAGLFTKSMQQLNQGKISWNGFEHNALLQNLSGKGFSNVAFLLGVGAEFDSRVVIGNDLDGDGLPDLLVSEYEFVGRGFVTKLHIYRNTLRTSRHWIGVRLRDDGVPGGWMGATAELDTGGRKQVRQLVTGDSFLSQHDTTFHFGLSELASVQRITVRWPNGQTRVLEKPEVDRYHTVVAGNAADR